MKGKEEFEAFTDEEIHNEIYRRNKERLKPKMVYNAVEHIKGHYNKLISSCKEYIDNIEEGNHTGTINDEHMIFEEAIKAIYGIHIFDWINKNT